MEIIINVAKLHEDLKNYIIGRYDNFKDIGDFYIEYSHEKNEYIIEVNDLVFDRYSYISRINMILESIYKIYQLENEPKEGRLYNLMIELEEIKKEINSIIYYKEI